MKCEQSSDGSLLGSLINERYRIVREIGRGDRGVVYAAYDERLKQEVALKVLAIRDSSDADSVARFFHEARLAAAMGHPNVVGTYDMGRLGDTRLFLAMPLLRGRSLRDVIDADAPMAGAEVVRLLRGAASGVDALHAKGLVHGDISPSNLFVEGLEHGAVITRILDFGLAVRGQSLGPSGDVYALAIVAYEMLTGLIPASPLLREHDGPKLGNDVQSVFRTALATEPERRYSSASEFVDNLEDAVCESATDTTRKVGRVSEVPSKPTAMALRPSDDIEALVIDIGPAIVDRREKLESHRNIVLRESVRSQRARSSLPTHHPSHRGLWVTFGLLAALLSGIFLWARESNESRELDKRAHAERAASMDRRPSAGLAPERPAIADIAKPTERDARQERDLIDAALPAANLPTSAERTPRHRGTGTSARRQRPTRAASDQANLLVGQGTKAFAQGNFSTAAARYRQAIEVDPGVAAAWRGLGLASEKLGKGREAKRAYLKYLRLRPHAADEAEIRNRVAALQ